MEGRPALMACNNLPFWVFNAAEGTIWLTNPGAEELVGLRADQIVGRKVTAFLIGPSNAVVATIHALDSGFIDAWRARRTLRRSTGTLLPIWVWSRAVTVGGRRGAVSLLVPTSEIGLAGRDPIAPWRSLATVVVGVADRNWQVEAVSKDILNFSNLCFNDIVGHSLVDLIEPVDKDDGSRAFRRSLVTSNIPPRRGQLRCPGGPAAEVRFLYSPLSGSGSGQLTLADDDGRKVFALVGAVDPNVAKSPSVRVRELELHLQRIGEEVRAAGIVGDIVDLPLFDEKSPMPDLGEFTVRQWAILSRLARGDRVPKIAADLYLSQSTVRNHLSAIFRKFGVHSQANLLAKLRAMRKDATPGD